MSLSNFVSRRSALTLVSSSFAACFLSPYSHGQQISVLRPRIEEAIQTLSTLQGDFIQIDTASGRGEAGKFWISRPGKLRFQYETSPELLIADGTHVARINRDSGSRSRVKIGSTVLRVILSDEIDLTDGITITAMEQTPDSLFVTMYETGKRNQGLLTLFLDINTYELRGWKIEEDDNTTTLILQDTQKDVAIDPDVFEIPRT